MSQKMIVGKNIVKSFSKPPIVILNSLNFEIEKGEFVACTGHSGSGKSTLLYVVSGLDTISSGEVYLAGENIHTMKSKEQHLFRNNKIGFVFQFHYLLTELTGLENMVFPAKKAKKEKEKKKEALEMIDLFGIGDCKNKLPSQISGGQQQRVAIARALIMQPEILFADEPTGNLDSSNGEKVMNIFEKINKEYKTTIMMVTHEVDYAKRAKRRIHLVDGNIVLDERNENGIRL